MYVKIKVCADLSLLLFSISDKSNKSYISTTMHVPKNSIIFRLPISLKDKVFESSPGDSEISSKLLGIRPKKDNVCAAGSLILSSV